MTSKAKREVQRSRARNHNKGWNMKHRIVRYFRFCVR